MNTNSQITVTRRWIPTFSFAVWFTVAFAVGAADDHIKIDNDQARVLFITSAAGVKSELHEHTVNRVMIYLDAGKMVLTNTAGKVETLNFKANEALWSPATTHPHVSLNVSDHPVRIVEVELKSKPGTSKSSKPARRDWVKADPKRYQVEIENDQVRVVRVRYGPHQKAPKRQYPFQLMVAFLAESKIRVTTPDGEAKMVTKAPGDVTWGGRSTYIEENLSDQPLEVLVIEFKE